MTGSTRLTSEVNKINVYLNFRGCPCFLLMIQTLRVTPQQLLKTFETDKKNTSSHWNSSKKRTSAIYISPMIYASVRQTKRLQCSYYCGLCGSLKMCSPNWRASEALLPFLRSLCSSFDPAFRCPDPNASPRPTERRPLRGRLVCEVNDYVSHAGASHIN